jgi:hypothetical protein
MKDLQYGLESGIGNKEVGTLYIMDISGKENRWWIWDVMMYESD